MHIYSSSKEVKGIGRLVLGWASWAGLLTFCTISIEYHIANGETLLRGGISVCGES